MNASFISAFSPRNLLEVRHDRSYSRREITGTQAEEIRHKRR